MSPLAPRDIFLKFMLLLTLCSNLEAHSKPLSISVMTYNVENLFDTEDDPGKDDETYLPLARKDSKEHRAKCAAIKRKLWRDQCLYWDWSKEVLELKLARIASAILASDPSGPDVLLLQEVENTAVLEQLRTKHLNMAGYQPGILIEGNDARGIDVAILSRFPLVGEAKLHSIPFHGKFKHRLNDTRGILVANLKLPNGEEMAVLNAHFPAPFHPFAMREQAMNYLSELGEMAAKSSHVVVAGGDFNVVANEDSRLYRRIAGKHWLVSHHVGCERCLGTSYFGPHDSWSFLDALMLFKGGKSGKFSYEINADSVEVSNGLPLQITKDGTPRRFDLKKGQLEGISDHWPVVMKLEAKPLSKADRKGS